MRIVIVDSEETSREVIKQAINTVVETHKIKSGCKIVGEAADGRKGCEIIVKERPDLIIMDLELPGKNGLPLLKKIRSEQIHSRAPPAIRTCTRPAPSSSPGTRCSRFPSTTAKWTRPNWTSSARPSMRTATTSTWCSRAPCTSRKAPNMAPSTPRPSCRPSPMWRTSTTCRCSWMARDSATR